MPYKGGGFNRGLKNVQLFTIWKKGEKIDSLSIFSVNKDGHWWTLIHGHGEMETPE
jgi:hypothetical protein